MSAIAHSHMRAIVPKISGNMRAIVPKGSLFSFLVLSIEFLKSIGGSRVGKRSSFRETSRLISIRHHGRQCCR